jgi:hypothetical protein
MSSAATLERTAPLHQRVKSVIPHIEWRDLDAAAGDAAVRLTTDGPASRAFADMTRATSVADAVAALDRAAPGFARALRRAGAAESPVIVARGLLADSVPPVTPYDGRVDPMASRRALLNLRAILGCLGLHPIAYEGESAAVAHAVCPTKGARGQLSSRGFDAALPFHTDYADRPIDEPVTDRSPAAAVLGFVVERAEAATPMEFVPARRLLAALSAEQIRTGRREEFAVRAPALFAGRFPPLARRLFLSGGRCRLNLATMTGVTSRAVRLLADISAILSDAAMVETIDVCRGDIVIMNNQRAIHRRAAFRPRWDGTDRYFIRMSAVRDMAGGIARDPRRPWSWSWS